MEKLDGLSLDLEKQNIDLNTHKTQVCHKYIFNGTLLNRQ